MKSLSRPMFRRGGGISAKNNGIVSGFNSGGSVRQNYAESDPAGVQPFTQYEAQDYVMAPEIKALIDQYVTDTVKPSGFSQSDYLRLAAAGADIMGAQPTGRSGFIGALQAASPALGSLGRDLGESMGEREQRYQDKLDAAKKTRLGIKLSDRERFLDKEDAKVAASTEFGQKLQIVNAEFQNDMKLLKEQLSVPQFETEFNLQAADEIYDKMKDLDPNSEEYKELQSKLENVLFASVQKTVLEGKIELLGDEDFQYSIESTVRSILEAELHLDPDSEYYEMSAADIKNKVTVDSFVEFGLNNVFVPSGRENNAKGGRVGFANGGDSYEERYREKQLDPGPMEPGNLNPDQYPQQAQSTGITFEELRARLPVEVSDGVVKLIATSEEALLDFANIETQEDISLFNQKYNTDLTLPAQVA